MGFSGGADSTALVQVLYDLSGILGISLAALHVNHGIRREAGEDEDFVREFCGKRDIPLRVVAKDVPGIAAKRGLTEEEAGRIVRYEAFLEYARDLGAEYIAVAHHQGDVAETLLLNLSRGSGLRGLGGIRPIREIGTAPGMETFIEGKTSSDSGVFSGEDTPKGSGGQRIIRPLLCVSRAEIEAFLGEREQSFCTDLTNLENDHTRNILRNVIVPEFEKGINSESVRHMCRTAELVSEADEYIRDVAKKEFDALATKRDDGIEVDAGRLRELPLIIRRNVILICFEEMIASRKDFTYQHVMDVIELADDLKGSASTDLPYGLIAQRQYETLLIKKKGNDKGEYPDVPICLKAGEETEVRLAGLGRACIRVFPHDKHEDIPRGAYTKWFDYDRIQEAIFRTRRKGDFISILQKGTVHRKPLSKFMTDEKIPAKARDSMYILADGSEVLWVPGYRRSDILRISDGTRNILEVSIINGGNKNG